MKLLYIDHILIIVVPKGWIVCTYKPSPSYVGAYILALIIISN